ncbi:MAG: radical SAM family heme chaperone HemW [Zoogloeaceae bacterium]|jgi:oxygen-independent coproporphyrinogen-3 oxidase|nr:radical SAM family heme chaperone HemW [Zoogloeaceae bacterium]
MAERFFLPPLSVYLHFPWCIQKCPYCDFNSHEARGSLPEAAYVAALLADLDAELACHAELGARSVISVFMGGGTPSLFSAEKIARLLAGLRARLLLSEDAEITLEANPGTLREEISEKKMWEWREAGVNRLSLGIQSFHDARLAALGRIHDAEEGRRAARDAARIFPRVNLDLMYGLPGETLEEACADARRALEFGVTHLSCYQLSIEPHTAFAAVPPDLPEEDLCAEMGEAMSGIFLRAGFARYEISAFAREGGQCRHNRNYWEFGDYLGLGAGAHGKLSFPRGVMRQERFSRPETYLRRVKFGGAARKNVRVAEADLPLEFLMNALRLSDGFSPALYAERTGLLYSALLPRLERAAALGLLRVTPDRVWATELGRRFLNRLLESLM